MRKIVDALGWMAWPLLAAVAGAVLLAAGDDAWARPGGGHNFSGGGSSGGGSGGGGGGDGAIVYFLVWLVIRYPHIGIPVVIVVGVGWFVMNRRKGDSTTTAAIRRLERQNSPVFEQISATRQRDLAALRSRDQSFDESSFLAAVKKGAERLTRAWCDEKLGDVRSFLSDGVYNRFSVLLDLNRVTGVRNVMADTSILSLAIAAVETDEMFDTVHVKVTGQARDMDIMTSRLAEKDRLLAHQPLSRYVEYWSLLRRRGATTRAGQTMEGMCPNCGATLERADVVVCDHCHAVVNSGEHGWVLAEITQESEFRASGQTREVSGLAALREDDPALSRQGLEDRGSYLFWKWVQAVAIMRTEGLARVAAPDMVMATENWVAQLRASGNLFALSKPAVGAVDLVSCAPNGEDGWDRAFVRVRWSAAWSTGGGPRPSTEVVVLARRTGARGRAGLSAITCANCSGPLASTDADVCEYCASPVSLNQNDWFMMQVGRPETVAIPDGRASEDRMPGWALPDLSDPADRMALLTRMASVMAADGVVEPRERKLLKITAKRWRVPFASVSPILEGRQAAPDVAPRTDEEKGLFLMGLVMAALVDGRVDTRERHMINGVAASMHLPPGFADSMIAAQSARLASKS